MPNPSILLIFSESGICLIQKWTDWKPASSKQSLISGNVHLQWWGTGYYFFQILLKTSFINGKAYAWHFIIIEKHFRVALLKKYKWYLMSAGNLANRNPYSLQLYEKAWGSFFCGFWRWKWRLILVFRSIMSNSACSHTYCTFNRRAFQSTVGWKHHQVVLPPSLPKKWITSTRKSKLIQYNTSSHHLCYEPFFFSKEPMDFNTLNTHFLKV